ncbi:MAG: 2-oxoglutarate dehydrogenase E1 component [Alicyclobacillus sp.]|nr:2-oxoglutarate dehydrogenase E1 component [Alicyclobacillus sp.]
MAERATGNTATWGNFAGPNYGYALELYDRYLADPNAVDEETRAYFERYGAPAAVPVTETAGTAGSGESVNSARVRATVAAVALVRNIREYGHRAADLNPLGVGERDQRVADPAQYGLSEDELASIPAEWIMDHPPATARTAADVIAHLRSVYTGSLGFDFRHVHDGEELQWLTQYVESGEVRRPLPREAKQELWRRLAQVESFEHFLHKTFVGQKRFSIEGVDILVPMLDSLVEAAIGEGTRQVVMGMAHRGRLNVLAHVLRKPYAAIFSEFHASPNKELVPSEGSMGINYGWTGDVKYHLGARHVVSEGELVEVRLSLAHNPSHLEFVNPVVIGSTRAEQDDRTHGGAPVTRVDKAISVLVHGDAAFPGEGVVAETLNMSRLAGYEVGGTVHIIANNQLGFTAESNESRSTRYASDLAKGFEIPVVHVNADDPEACINAIWFAFAYRQRFHKDFLIDLVGYRRYGHNEMDDPSMTQPLLYDIINQHPTVRALYQERLVREGILTESDCQAWEAKLEQQLKSALAEVTSGAVRQTAPELSPEADDTLPETGVAADDLRRVNQELLTWPEDFTAYPKLARILQRRSQSFEAGGTVDWAHAETLAFATILENGTPVRLTGQDSERGTFGQRHLVLHDVRTGRRYAPLQHLSTAKASFDVHNSPLSETAVIGFEYGYDVHAPEALVLWEAQFGDFANVGQVLIDQFIASGRAKWGQESGLVLLLPHGYEGQGPEHSSARLERYLQLSAENNWVVANVTTSAQYFHLLRLQAQRLLTSPRPLVLMTPKSLLRNPKAASPWEALTAGRFQRVLAIGSADAAKVRRLVLSTGKVGVDLETDLEKSGRAEWLAVARVEQLYPFPATELADQIAQFPNLQEIVWLQEEPLNMGAWSYVEPHLRKLTKGNLPVVYVGRKAHASPAEGLADVHQTVQAQIVQAVQQEQLDTDGMAF